MRSLMWTLKCGSYGRLARYLLPFLFFTRRTLWFPYGNCTEIVPGEPLRCWANARGVANHRPVVGHSDANTGPANHQSYGRMFAKFASRPMTRSARTLFGGRQRRASDGIHHPADSERLFVPFYSQKVGQLGRVL